VGLPLRITSAYGNIRHRTRNADMTHFRLAVIIIATLATAAFYIIAI
jgi:hypothetical protein